MSVSFPSLVEIEDLLGAADTAALEPLRLAVLREVTVEPIDAYLRYLANRDGMNGSIAFGGFGALAAEAVGGAGATLNRDLDAVLVFAPLIAISTALWSDFATLDTQRVEDEVGRLKSLFESLVAGIRRQTDAMILWHGLEPPLYPSIGIMDAQRRDGQAAVVADLNAVLRTSLQAVPGAYFVDMAACLARVGASRFYDARYWHLARAPYTPTALAAIAAEDFKFVRALKGKAKKCLIVDCDNTLWGGIVGEDGMSGIKLGTDYPGSAYLEFQREVVSLAARGVMVAICSKNNEADVWEVFDRHPDMALRRHHIAASRINWRDKATNVRELAAELNIGLDSIVLADDSEFESGLVRDQLPEVEVLDLRQAHPVGYRNELASCGFFDRITLTNEDRARGAMYGIESARRRARAQAPDLESYYRSLEMTLEIGYADELSIPRVAQLTQKTNQFNLTTRRYGEGEIARLARSPQHDVLWVRAGDRLGDLGIVGACVLEYSERAVAIDSLLLSCRALGRGIEHAFLSEILHISRARDARSVQGEYIRTAKNAQVERFFVENGFSEIGDGRPDRRRFERLLDALPPREHGHFSNVASPLGVMTARQM